MANTEIYICFNCGAKNRVPSSRLSVAKCGKCHKPLLETASKPDSKPKPSPSPQKPHSSSYSRPNRSLPWRLVFFAVLFAGAGYIFFSEQSNAPSRSTTTAALPPVVYQTPGVMWNKTGRTGSAPFEIITSAGADYYIKLVDYSSGSDQMGIFVKGGQTLEIKVPPGSYKIRYASGEAWRGLLSLFGPGSHTSYQQSSTRFDFSQYEGYTVELIRQSGGNMPTRSIGASQF